MLKHASRIKLPATIEQAKTQLARTEMEEFARVVVLEPWFEIEESGREIVKNMLRNCYRYLADNMRDGVVDLINLSDWGDPDADQVLLEMVNDYERERREKPTDLAYFVMKMSKRGDGWNFKKHPGKKPINYVFRDLALVHAIAALYDRYSLLPTRSSDKKFCGCDIVGAVVRPALGYKQMEEIWLRRGGVTNGLLSGSWAR